MPREAAVRVAGHVQRSCSAVETGTLGNREHLETATFTDIV